MDTKNTEVNTFENELKKLKTKLSNDDYAKDLYGALCNMKWKHVATGSVYSCSWRYAGGLVADMRDKKEMYLDYYCSGNEGLVTLEVERDLAELGWVPEPWEEVA